MSPARHDLCPRLRLVASDSLNAKAQAADERPKFPLFDSARWRLDANPNPNLNLRVAIRDRSTRFDCFD